MNIKPIQLVLDNDGNLIQKNARPIRANANYTYLVQVVSPNLSTDVCDITVSTFGSIIGKESVRCNLAVDSDNVPLKGSDVVDGNKPYYDAVKDYNVWEVNIMGTVLAIISKLNTGKLGIQSTFSEAVADYRLVNDLGTFGSNTTTVEDLPSPLGMTDGDYYTLAVRNYYSTQTDKTYQYKDSVFILEEEWYLASTYRQVQSSPLVSFYVDPAITLEYDELPPELVDQIIASQSNLEGQIAGIQAAIAAEEAARLAGDVGLEVSKADVVHTHVEADIVNLDKYTKAEVDSLLDDKFSQNHDHDELYQPIGDYANGTDTTNALALKADLVNGTIPASQIPGAYDDYTEVATYAALPIEGTQGIMYIVTADETSGGNTSTYRWTGTVYVRISNELSASEIKSLYESNLDTNAFSDAEATKLAGIEENATADQTGAEIKASLFAEPDTNNFDNNYKIQVDTNTNKVGITAQQAADIEANNLKVGITPTQTANIAANTLKVGITQEQADDIIANNAKISFDSASSTKLAGIEAGAEVNDPNTTLKGNTFNGNSQLVETTADGKLPALDGSLLTNLISPLASTDHLPEGTVNLYYTDARADARIALVIDSAPGALDTLNELAAALGDDPNFATTITNALANKVDKVVGYGLSQNDFSNTYKGYVDANNLKISYTDAAAVAANTTHRTSDGSDHTFIDQDVTNGSMPSFGALKHTIQSTPPTHTPGMIWYDGRTLWLDVQPPQMRIPIGQGEYRYVRNETGTTIPAMRLIYPSGANQTEGLSLIDYCDNRDKETLQLVGLTIMDIPNNSNGWVCTSGSVLNVDTSLYSLGDVLFLDNDTPGQLTTTYPAKDGYEVIVGLVRKSHATEGTIGVQLRVSQNTVEANNLNGFPKYHQEDVDLTYSGLQVNVIPTNALNKFHFYVNGIKFIKSGTQSFTLSSTSGSHYLYYNTDGILQELVNPTSTQVAQIFINECAVAYAVVTDGSIIALGDEKHGMDMPPAVHGYLHRYMKAQYESGMQPGSYIVDGNGGLAAHAQVTLTAGSFTDEDIDHSLDEFLLSDSYEVYYNEGTVPNHQIKKQSALAGYVHLMGTTLPYYNDLTGTVWSLQEVTSNYYVLTHIFASTFIDETNLSKRKYIIVMGQAEYSSAVLARAGAETEITTLRSSLVFPEFIPVATFISQVKTSYTNATKSRFVSAEDGDYIDWRLSVGQDGSIGTTSNLHPNLLLRDAPDSHPADAISYDNTTSGLVAVEVQGALDELDNRLDTNDAATALNTAKVGITPQQAADIEANNLKVGITPQQASDILTNNAKVGITPQQAADIETNNLKVGITPQQAADIIANNAKISYTDAAAVAANTAKVGITQQQADAIVANTAKVGITTAQADAIIANTAKISYTDAAAVAANIAKISFDSASSTKLAGIEAGAEVNDPNTTLQGNVFNGNSQLVQTTVDGKLPTIDGSLLTNVVADVGSTDNVPEGSTNLYYTDARADARIALIIDTAPESLNTLNELAAALGDDPNFATTVTNSLANKVDKVTGYGLSQNDFSNTYKGYVDANNLKVGITTTQANDILTNNAKVGITTQQSDAIVANTAKVGITPQQADDISTNNLKVGITTTQANAIVANTAKISYTDAAAVAANTAKISADPNATNQGNTFNGNSQLVQTTADGKLPALDASNLTGLNKTNWDTAYGWGDHSTVGYLTEHQSLADLVPLQVGGSLDVDAENGTGLFVGSSGTWTNRGTTGNNASALLSLNTHPGNYYSQFWFDSLGGEFYHRSWSATTPGAWHKVLTSNNIGDYGYITDYIVTQADVTAHQAALSITESQISDLGTYYLASNPSGFITGYTVTQSDVTAHQAALSITESQISDLGTYEPAINTNGTYTFGAIEFSDPGTNEGLYWKGGNLWRIFESPNTFANSAGNLQFVTNATRRMTLDTSGNLEVLGTISATNLSTSNWNTAYTHSQLSSGNPHGVTKTDVSLGNVLNYGIATTLEAEDHTNNVKYMTPARTRDAIEKVMNFSVATGKLTIDLD